MGTARSTPAKYENIKYGSGTIKLNVFLNTSRLVLLGIHNQIWETGGDIGQSESLQSDGTPTRSIEVNSKGTATHMLLYGIITESRMNSVL